MTAVRPISACRACGGDLSIAFCDLGEQPLANGYLRTADLSRPEPRFPLEVRVCADCRLAQLAHIVDERAIFCDYAYLSSTSTSWMAHAAEFARWAAERFALGDGSFVVEVASNDGYLLRNFVAARIPCLGVEPAANVAALAIAAGVPTEVDFLNEETAQRIVQQKRTADLVIANNVLAHVPDLNDFVAGLAVLLGSSGVLSIEVPHLLSLIRRMQFDTIYHEHYAYWSLYAIERLLARHGLVVFDVHRLATHGGSLRVFAASAARKPSHRLDVLRKQEEDAGINQADLYRGFDERVADIVAEFRAYLARAKAEGRRVAAYGAAAKGNTFLNRIGATPADIMMVADANPLKQGTFLPGSHIPVVDLGALIAAMPDDVIILPWNLTTEIAQQLRAAGFGGRIVTAIPRLNVQ